MIDRRCPILVLCCLLAGQAHAGAMSHSSVHVKGKWKIDVKLPVWSQGSAVQRSAQREFARRAAALKKQFLKDSVEGLQCAKRNGQELAFDVETTLSLDTPKLVSGFMTVFIDMAGAHPTTQEIAVTIGPTGTVRLKDVVTVPSKVLSGVVTDGLKAEKDARGTKLDAPIDAALSDSFIVTPNGLTWIFGQYAVGAYAEGEYLVKVPWAKLKPFLRPKSVIASLVR